MARSRGRPPVEADDALLAEVADLILLRHCWVGSAIGDVLRRRSRPSKATFASAYVTLFGKWRRNSRALLAAAVERRRRRIRQTINLLIYLEQGRRQTEALQAAMEKYPLRE